MNYRFSVLLVILMIVTSVAGSRLPDNPVARIHDKALTIDTHCDTPMSLVEGNFDIGQRHSPPGSRVDFPRMKEGGLDAQFFAVFTSQRDRTPDNIQAAHELANRMVDSIYAVCDRYKNLAEVAFTSADAPRIEKMGKRAIYIGLENGFPFGTNLGRIQEFYNKGVRYITLCHTSNNDICDSSTDRKGKEHNGLSDFGKKVVKEMNRLGMIIDVSHISDKSFYDVIENSTAPVIASHSSVRAIAHSPRNLTDDMIKKLAKNGGVIQICLLDEYIKDPDTTSVRYKKESEFREIFRTRSAQMSEAERAELRKQWSEFRESTPRDLPTVADLVDHIDHVKKLVGVDYVGIGSDFDGGGGLADCQDVSQFPNITAELVKRGYTEKEIDKIWGGNFFRVFSRVEKLAAQSNPQVIHGK